MVPSWQNHWWYVISFCIYYLLDSSVILLIIACPLLRRNHLPWSDGDVCSLVSRDELAAHFHWCQECLRVLGPSLLQLNHHCHLPAYQRVEGISKGLQWNNDGIANQATFQDTGAGLAAACFIAIVPGYISRSVAGSYDNEGIAIFCMLFTYYLWIKSVKTGSLLWGAFCALAYFYMASRLWIFSWSPTVFIDELLPNPLGFIMGRLRLSYQPNPSSCSNSDPNRSILSSCVCGIQHGLRSRNFAVYANRLCGVPACTELGAYAGNVFFSFSILIFNQRPDFGCSMFFLAEGLWSFWTLPAPCLYRLRP